MIWIGVDAHKRLHQAMVLGSQGEILGERTITNDAAAWQELLEWARALGTERIWAVEAPGTWAAVWRSSWRALASACMR